MQIGMATGEERRQMLCLRKKQWELELVAGDGTMAIGGSWSILVKATTG